MLNLQPYVADAQKIEQQTGIPASVTLAQMIQESQVGNHLSGLASQANNLFGIKGKGDAGSITMPTTEYINGKKVTVNAQFAKYSSPYASMQAYAHLLSGSNYAKHLKGAKSVNDYVNGIVAGGYATDPNYAKNLLNVISTDNLHQYDTGNYTFSPMSFENGATGSGSGSGASGNGQTGILGDVFYGSLHGLMILGLFVLSIVFLIQAFPAIGEQAQKAGKAAIKVAALA